jgi:hypothetical protein
MYQDGALQKGSFEKLGPLKFFRQSDHLNNR